nr:hypothetical protein [Tanacetum cinerariifolium]
CGLLVLVLSGPIEDKPFKSEFTFFLVMTEDAERTLSFFVSLLGYGLLVLVLSSPVEDKPFRQILNMPEAITLALFTTLETGGVETKLEVTGFDKAFVSPILERISTVGCFANIAFLLES